MQFMIFIQYVFHRHRKGIEESMTEKINPET